MVMVKSCENVAMIILNILANTYLFKVNSINIKKSKICSKLTIKNQNDVSHLFIEFLFLTLSK